MYKLFTKIITTRLEKKLDENQPREQTGFRSKYSTTDHIHAINQVKEKCREYNIPLCVAFVDYEKAFDSVQTQAILTSLQEQGIEDVYIEILKDIYTDSSVTVHLLGLKMNIAKTKVMVVDKESWQAGRHTPNTGISSKATLPSAWRDRCTTPVCCQLWHMVQRPGHWPNKHRTKLGWHRPKWKEVCSTSHTKIEGPTSGLGRGQNS